MRKQQAFMLLSTIDSMIKQRIHNPTQFDPSDVDVRFLLRTLRTLKKHFQFVVQFVSAAVRDTEIASG